MPPKLILYLFHLNISKNKIILKDKIYKIEIQLIDSMYGLMVLRNKGHQNILNYWQKRNLKLGSEKKSRLNKTLRSN